MTHTETPPTRPPAWDRDTLRDPHAGRDKAARVEAMFDAIAPTYERINRLVSLRRDAVWRREAITAAQARPADVVLDVCCGTGDMIRTVGTQTPPPKLLIGIDFARRMLARGRYDGIGTPIQLIRADALRLPLDEATVDVVTCAFGVRNFQDLLAGLREMYRVLRPGGRVVILEFALPENPLLRWGYRWYCERILPRLAALVIRDKTGAYRYLPSSIRTFERRAAMAEQLENAGFSNVATRPLNLGGVVIYRGVKRDTQGPPCSPVPRGSGQTVRISTVTEAGLCGDRGTKTGPGGRRARASLLRQFFAGLPGLGPSLQERTIEPAGRLSNSVHMLHGSRPRPGDRPACRRFPSSRPARVIGL